MSNDNEKQLSPGSIARYVYDKAKDIPLPINSSINEDLLAAIIEDYGNQRVNNELNEILTELKEFHAERRDSSDKKLEYAHHHGIVEGIVKVEKKLRKKVNDEEKE